MRFLSHFSIKNSQNLFNIRFLSHFFIKNSQSLLADIFDQKKQPKNPETFLLKKTPQQSTPFQQHKLKIPLKTDHSFIVFTLNRRSNAAAKGHHQKQEQHPNEIQLFCAHFLSSPILAFFYAQRPAFIAEMQEADVKGPLQVAYCRHPLPPILLLLFSMTAKNAHC
jgi:hypothetical protein